GRRRSARRPALGAAGYDRSDSPAPVPHPYASVRESRVAATPLALLTAVGGV
ncbi:hypothetical protein G6539_23420, partial [Streptomyces albidoflavus]|nr:hypothetical protein [Streptomyces albidoflavus]